MSRFVSTSKVVEKTGLERQGLFVVTGSCWSRSVVAVAPTRGELKSFLRISVQSGVSGETSIAFMMEHNKRRDI